MSVHQTRLETGIAKAVRCLEGLTLRYMGTATAHGTKRQLNLDTLVGRIAGKEIAQEIRNIAASGIANAQHIAEEEPLLVGTSAGDALHDIELMFTVLTAFADAIDGRDPMKIAAAFAAAKQAKEAP